MHTYLFEKVEYVTDALESVPQSRHGMPMRIVAGSALEDEFPHVLHAIQLMWGHAELESYLDSLTMDRRGGRAGFPPQVWSEIYFLIELHQYRTKHPFP